MKYIVALIILVTGAGFIYLEWITGDSIYVNVYFALLFTYFTFTQFINEMKNLFLYHIVTLVPLIVILYLYSFNIMDTLWFIILMLAYAFIYRPIFDVKRLKALDVIDGSEGFWKIFWILRFKHYGALMFKN